MELHVFSFWNVWKKVAPYLQSSLRPEIFILVTCDLPPHCYVFFMSSYWLLGIFILVLIGRFDKLGFGSWHSIQNLSFQKQLSFTYWPSRSFLWISLTSKDKQARPTVLSHNRKKLNKETSKFARNKVKLLKRMKGGDGKRMTYFSRVPSIKQASSPLLWTRDPINDDNESFFGSSFSFSNGVSNHAPFRFEVLCATAEYVL